MTFAGRSIPRIITVISATGLMLLGSISTLSAEEQPEPKPPIIIQRQTNPAEEQFRQQLSLARKLIDSKNWTGAAAVLETLYETDPANGVVINELMKCLDELKQYPKAVDLVNREISRQPNNIYLRLRLAEYLVKQDSLGPALAVYNQTINLAGDDNLGNQQSIVNNLVFFGLPERAAELIDSLRTVTGDSALFALQKGGIFEQKREYETATREYYQLLGDTARSAIDAEKKLISLLEFPTSSDAALKELTRLADRDSNIKLFKILSDFYLKQQMFEPAFDYAIRRDSSGNQSGAGLLTFLRNCRERDLHDETIRMARYILDNYESSPIIPETYFIYAEALTDRGDFEAAIAVYDTITAVLPRIQDKSDALYRIGSIYSEHYNDCYTGLDYFDSVITAYPAGTGFVDALLSRPNCYMRLSEYEKARADYNALKNRHLDENRSEQIDYNLALMDFFEYDFDSCNVFFRKVLVDFPKGYYVNDALRLLMVMSDAEGDKELLQLYSSAEMFKMRRLTDSTIQRLEALTRTINRSLADNALYDLTNISMARSDTLSALAYIAKLKDEFADSYYLPYGLKLQADILMTKSDRQAEAADIYRTLLENYPNYPFASKVREIMREIQTQKPVG